MHFHEGVPLKTNETRFALLIDCDNVSSNAVEGVLAELARHGTVNVRHAHGDWKSSHLNGWVEKLQANAIRPVQQFAYTSGKNATDAAMIISAMDLLYGNHVDAFALMTSDSDFTPLVMRITESGRPVFGFGERKAPRAFVQACSQFIFIEELVHIQASKVSEAPLPVKQAGDRLLIEDRALADLLRNAVDQVSDGDGWSHMSKVGTYISRNSSLSPADHGYKNLGAMFRASGMFDINLRDGSAMYVRPRVLRLVPEPSKFA